MTGLQQVVRSLYTRLSSVDAINGMLDVVRRRSFVRKLARRNLAVLLSSGSTWVNVDGSLRLIAEDDQPVVFGPWHGDATTELLYWIPFLRWAREHFELDPARCVAASRGGVGHWYAEVCARYVELHDHFDEDELAGLTPDALRALPGLRNASIFPPGPILDLVASYREGTMGSRPFLKRTRHSQLPSPDDPATAGLPNEYVAVALSPTGAFPDSGETRERAERLVRRLSDATDVVSVDGAAWGDPVARPIADVSANRRLKAQHAVIARSRGLVAAYSELVPLALLTGVPVIALRAGDAPIQNADLDMALLVGSESGGSLNVLDLGDLDSLHEVLGGSSASSGGES